MSFVVTAEGASVAPAIRRSRLAGTPQQEAFWEELLTGTDHVLLEARAGTGKSTSCREAMWRLREEGADPVIRYCCFNKKIADEFAETCPPGVEVGTMHRFGLLALRGAFGSQVDKLKTYLVLDAIEGGPELPRYFRRSIASLVSLAKNHGLQPDGEECNGDNEALYRLVSLYDIEAYGKEDDLLRWAEKVLYRSAEMTSIVDFDDMLWLTTIHPVRFPAVDFLFIDEAQDLNPTQHLMAEQLSGSGRTIVVGDPFQSIYAFRGADSNSIARLRDKLGARTMPLTVTFRCPRSHVELARRLVPDFEAAPEAPEGVLRNLGPDCVDHARPGDLVLCRANAPIIAACLRTIARSTPAIVRGRAIGDQLGSIVRRVARPGVDTIPQFIRALAAWKARELGRLEAKDGTEDLIEAMLDRVACVEAIAGSCDSPTSIPRAIDRLFSDDDEKGRVTFSSVHRAKGSEARDVTFIDLPYSESRDKARPPRQWELDQRRNLRYVALTRSLDTLTLTTPN